ncbi:MAG: glycerol-3-phosphate 1-O-acyltransferase PlsY [Betaproteobacteria bacterium]|nr:glycerol-3-phosphate 1-O-acyltransferase PlsY [Betaproteobacteria bacterium]
MTSLILVAILAYLIGSLSFAVIVSHLMGLPDPRTFGSRNPGATNMLRGGSRIAAALVLLGDALKGWLAVWLVAHVALPLGVDPRALPAAAIAVFLGHGYPVFFGFRGGKGVATALGVLLAFQSALGLATLIVWLSVMAVTRISSVSALCAAVAAPLLALLFVHDAWGRLTILALALLLIAHHHGNIRRLLKGEESVFRKKTH